METQVMGTRPQRVKKRAKRYRVPVTLFLTRDEAVAMRKRASELGLQFSNWATRVCLEEMQRPARLPVPAKDGGLKPAA